MKDIHTMTSIQRMKRIEVRDLTKTYTTYKRGSGLADVLKSVFVREAEEVRALKGINFDVEEGELVGFLGPNGAGKSTTLKILTGVLHPTSGSVDALGYCPWKQRKRYVANIGAVFGQKSQLIWDIPPMDSFLMNQAIYGIADGDFKATLAELAGLLGVEELMKRPTRNLSLGERMKCEFIMAMLHRPRVVFLDEPTIGLDVIAKETIRDFIRRMNAEGVTFILTTHDLADVESLARRVIVVNHGELVFDDTLESLRGYFGSRKRIRLVTARAAADLDLGGLEETGRESDTDVSYELNLAVTPLNRFIARANERTEIRDMSIEEIPIERVIKDLYERKEET
jgi:ABC-2 type transport system ATP-binding protein